MENARESRHEQENLTGGHTANTGMFSPLLAVKESTHFLLLSEIVYATAHGRNCIIYTMSGEEVHARMSITDFIAAAGERFTTVHRSYSVNNAYISCVQKYEVVMLDGNKIPIPVKKYKEVREALTEMHDIQVK